MARFTSPSWHMTLSKSWLRALARIKASIHALQIPMARRRALQLLPKCSMHAVLSSRGFDGRSLWMPWSQDQFLDSRLQNVLRVDKSFFRHLLDQRRAPRERDEGHVLIGLPDGRGGLRQLPDVPRARPIACDGSSRLPHMLSLLVAQMKRRGRDWKNPDGVASLRIPVVVPTICLVPYSNPVQRERRWWRATTRRGAAPSAVPCRRVVVIPLVSGCVPML